MQILQLASTPGKTLFPTSNIKFQIRLAQNLADPDTYPDVKDPAVDLVYFAAEEWATATGWQPGPSDV